MAAIVTQTTKMSTLEYAKKTIFGPLGITDACWCNKNSRLYNIAGCLSLTPRDQIKFGLMNLHGGIWENSQLDPAEFVANSVKTSKTSPIPVPVVMFGKVVGLPDG